MKLMGKNSSSDLAFFLIILLIVYLQLAFSILGFVEGTAACRTRQLGKKRSINRSQLYEKRIIRRTTEHSKSSSSSHNINNINFDAPSRARPAPTVLLPPLLPASNFHILSYGAKGDGVSDDSKALTAAWKAACQLVPGPGEASATATATVVIPADFRFLIKPLTLQGPCIPHQLLLQLDGTLLMAPHPKLIGSNNNILFQWINFKWVHNFTIQGTGTIDGQGSNWWPMIDNSSSSSPMAASRKSKRPFKHPRRPPFYEYHYMIKPTALRFYGSYNVTIRDINIVNSPQCHLKFDNSGGVKIDNITISAPENSPNTDGIHLQNTHDVEIQHSNIGCGDDCVSIQTGCSNIHVHNINCGPGHGISIGGLGKDKSRACVSNIMVENIFMQNTLYGARIKTWQGGIGWVKNVSFSNINVWEVKVPVQIDQYYCDKRLCKNQTAAVAISGVKFERVIGTYSVQPFHIACSQEIPCVDVGLIEIHLLEASTNSSSSSSSSRSGFQEGVCWNSYGRTEGVLVPSSMDNCLRRGSSSLVNRSSIARSKHDHEHRSCSIRTL